MQTPVVMTIFYPAFLYSMHHIEPTPLLPPHLLPPKRAPLRQPCFSPRRLTKHSRAPPTNNNCLGVREDDCDCEAAWTFYIHEEGAGGGDEDL